jgi:hypothetical protein
MQFLVLLITLVVCESSSIDGDILSEMREEFAQMKAEMTKMKAETTELKAEITELKAQRNATTAGELKLFVDGRTVCPDDTVEVHVTKGMVLLGRPDGGKSGEVFNRPFDAGEIGRSSPHSHIVYDHGHTHVGIVNDPGHSHTIEHAGGDGTPGLQWGGNALLSHGSTRVNKTGISVENIVSKTGISIEMDPNDPGEHLPLVYVLICQKVA